MVWLPQEKRKRQRQVNAKVLESFFMSYRFFGPARNTDCRDEDRQFSAGLQNGNLAGPTICRRKGKLLVFLWNLGAEDLENTHHNSDDKSDAHIEEGIFPGIQFAEYPHQERVTETLYSFSSSSSRPKLAIISQ